MRMLVCAAVIAASGPALAAEPIVEACEKATAFYLMVPEVAGSDVQAFPELEPPRVSMRISYEVEAGGAIDSLLSGGGTTTVTRDDPVSCTFDRNTAPFGLAAYCPPDGCGFMPASRLEELQALMKRAGY